MIYFRPTAADDLQEVAYNMRECDVNEVWASHRHLPIESLMHAYAVSTKCWSAMDDEGPFAIFGVAPFGSLLSEVGVPWMLGTERVEKHGVTIVRHSADFIREMMIGHRALVNWVDARSTTSIRWLKWCGFTVEEPQPYGHANMPFHRFHMKNEVESHV